MNDDYQPNLENQPNTPGLLSRIKDVIWLIPRKLRIVISIILGALIVILLLNAFKPEAQKREIPETVVRVDVTQVFPASYPIVVNANGTIEAETRGNLVAQIRGEIVAMSDNFKTGGTFKKGDVLIQIDPRDYEAARSQSLAALSQAEAAYRQEQANAKQAEQDWGRLGNTSAAPDLVLRKPQLAAAKAQRDSALAAHQTAELNLSRTTLTAPYNGRIIRRDAVLGQYVSIGTPIAEVFATDGVEVRLPISQEEFSQLGLDSLANGTDAANSFDVEISSANSHNQHFWKAKITRTDSTFDINTRQIDVIADVEDPFGRQGGQPPLKIGQFVSARITGRTIDNVYVIPNKSIREGSYLYTVRDQRLAKQRVNILWQDDQNALVAAHSASEESNADDGFAADIKPGELVVITSLNSTLAGAKAKLSEEAKAAIAKPENETPSSHVTQSPPDTDVVKTNVVEIDISETNDVETSELGESIDAQEPTDTVETSVEESKTEGILESVEESIDESGDTKAANVSSSSPASN